MERSTTAVALRYVGLMAFTAAAAALLGSFAEVALEQTWHPGGVASDVVDNLPLMITLVAIFSLRARLKVLAGWPRESVSA